MCTLKYSIFALSCMWNLAVSVVLSSSSLYGAANIGGHLVSNIRPICKRYSELDHKLFHKDIDRLCHHRLRSRNSFSQRRVRVRYYDGVLVSLSLFGKRLGISMEKKSRQSGGGDSRSFLCCLLTWKFRVHDI